ncbi:K02A2.6-like [Cordylochernes scorpioides]|uniref:RNA-directed DNA polymerase n=1 Tax=Cordylochernes scorpioides TaxID=51811 RepID=A0ABY6K8V7_9ARAC|nr:K02A2.6-like [Cordylochernes scorpioides]
MGPLKKYVERELGKKKDIITMEGKREMIEKHELGMRVTEIARFYKKSTSTICTILKKKKELRELDAAKGVTRLSKQRPRLLEEVEKLILVWINEKQLAGDTITQNLICEKAKALYAELGSKIPCTSIENEVHADFKASKGWFENFKRRSGIHSVTRHGEGASSDAKAAELVVTCVTSHSKFLTVMKQDFFGKDAEENLHYSRSEYNARHKPMKDRLTLPSDQIREICKMWETVQLSDTAKINGVSLFKSFNLNNADKNNLSIVKDKFNNYFSPKLNTTIERFKFNQMKQKEDESFNDFLTRIKLQIANCKYAVMSDELLKDRIVVGIINNEIRERLLSEADLNLEKATQICIACENATNQMKHVLSNSDKQVAVTKMNSKKWEDSKEPRKENITNQSHKIIENCRNCGRSHKINQCPAYQKRCNKCKKLNHFANLCRSQNTNSYKVRQIVGSPEPEMNQEFVIQSVENTNLTEDWYEEVKIKGKKVNMKLDTGAQCNVLPISLAGRLNLEIQRSPVKSLISFSGHRIPVEGQSLAMCMVKNMTAYIRFIISRDNTCPILGRQTCSNLGLVKRVNTCQAITQEYQELFEGIGCLKGYEYEAKFQTSDMNMQVRPPRPIPLSIKERAKKELEDTYLEENFEVLMTTPTNKSSYEELQTLTKEDQELQELKTLILYGWPNYKSAVPESCKKYWPYRDELSTNEDLIFKGSRVFIPLRWKAKILKLIHEGHQGTNSCLRRARDSIYWHGISQDIINTVENCRTCQANQRNKTKEPMIIKEIPSLPWEIVAADIFSIKGKNYLLITDNYSGFIDFKEMKTMNSAETIESLKKWFSVHGIPRLLETDNGPNFTSRDFKDFQKKWLFDHQTSSPLYPKSNGLAERAVQTAKNLIRKCLDSGQEVELALLNFYNTPRDGLPSPAQCLFSRRTRTLLPTSTHQLEPEIQKGHTQNLRNKREKQKTHHDKTAKTTRSFKEGEKIMLKQHHREWIPARVTQEVAPRSYKVQTPTGEYRRNSSFMRHTNLESPKQQRRRIPEIPKSTLPEGPGPSGDKEQAQVPEELNTSPRPFSGQEPRSDHQNAEHKNGTLPITTRSGRIIKPPKRFEE